MANKDTSDESIDLSEMTVVVSEEDIPTSTVIRQEDTTSSWLNTDGTKTILQGLPFFSLRRTLVDDTLDLTGKTPRKKVDASVLDEKNLTDVKSRYRVDDHPFASGGQGSISSAVDRSLGCEVALKSLHKNISEDEVARNAFFTEARLTAALDHPSIIPIHGLFGDAQNGLHLAMKLIDGYTLKSYLEQIVRTYEIERIHNFNESQSLRNRLDTFLRVCDAIEYAHDRKIIHRDLKPENIMIGRHRETYVTDWGIAARLGEPAPEKLKGTPAYLAPEVMKDKKADIRSDIYSLGVILFEMVFLTRAFPGNDVKEILARVRDGRHAPLRHMFNCRIDADLKAIILKAIAVKPEKRYQTVQQLSLDLRHYLAHEEVSARPDNLFRSIGRWGFNHRRRMVFSVMGLLLLAVGGIAYTLHKEFKGSMEKRLHERSASIAYASAAAAANEMGQNIRHIEHMLDSFRKYILFSTLKVQVPGYQPDHLFIELGKLRKNPPASFAYSEKHRAKVDFEHVCVFNFRKRKLDTAEFKYFGNTTEFMRKIFWHGLEDHFTDDGTKKNLSEFDKSIRTVYFALENGMFAVFPGMTDFPGTYYPPGRNWYKQALIQDGRPFWSKPYRDIGSSNEMVMTCSIAIKGLQDKFIGVSAVDFSLKKMAEKQFNPVGRLSRFTIRKMLINKDGEIILSLDNQQGVNCPKPDDFLCRRMFRQRYGTRVWQAEGKQILYTFAHIQPLDMLYVECLDFESLVAFVQASTI